MKLLAFFILFLVYPFRDNAATLPLNSAGKVSFEETVAVAGLNKDMLFRNATNYVVNVKQLGNENKKLKASYQSGVVRKTGSFLVYKQGLFTPQVHGEIIYNLSIQVTDEEFTYHFTDFVFQYYEKNRYGVYAPVNGKKKGLEVEKFAGMQELWEAHKKTTRRHIDNHIAAIKASMSTIPPGAGLYDEEHYKELN